MSFNRRDTGCLLSIFHLAMLFFWLAHKIQPANLGTCKAVCAFVLGLLCPGFTEDAASVHPVSAHPAIVCLRSLGFLYVFFFFKQTDGNSSCKKHYKDGSKRICQERDEEWKGNDKTRNLLHFPIYCNSYIPTPLLPRTVGMVA